MSKTTVSRSPGPARRLAAVRRFAALWAALFATPAGLPAQSFPSDRFPLQAPPASSAPAGRLLERFQPGAVRPVQNTLDRPLDHRIVALPEATEDLEIIHRRSQLVVTRSNVVRMAIADPSIIDVVQYSPTEVAVIGLALGSTTLTVWFDGSAQPLIHDVTVIRDPSIEDQKRVDYGRLERKIAELFPNSKVYLIPLSQKIVVKGQARDAEEAAHILQIVRGEVINQLGSLAGPQPILQINDAALGADTNAINAWDLGSSLIVNMLEVPGESQIMVRVRIAELNRSQLRQMGVDWSVLFNSGRHLVSSSLGGVPATLTGVFENGEINVLVNWLQSNGTAKILAEPVLTILSGHSGSFLSGGEFAVPTILGVNGAQGQTTTFRGFGTSIIVTPQLIDRDLIRMVIIPEFSQLNAANSVNGIPGVDARRVQTTVQLREGQTIVIGGLLSRRTNTEVTRIPFLGEIPWVGGALFNTKRSTEDETELLILVSPEIVRPMDADEVPPVPGFEVTHPDDHSLYFRAMTQGPPDVGYYQLAPYGSGNGRGIDVGYSLFNPAPASPQYAPVPTNPYGAAMPGGAGYGPAQQFGPAPGGSTPGGPAYGQPAPGYGPAAPGYGQPVPNYGQPGPFQSPGNPSPYDGIQPAPGRMFPVPDDAGGHSAPPLPAPPVDAGRRGVTPVAGPASTRTDRNFDRFRTDRSAGGRY
ncbi:MAG: pilus assembly protein N-terminal domain-containing protein [Planctomycetales bacterium]